MTDRDDLDVEQLVLPEPAATLFRRTREALETYIGQHTPNGEGIRLAGGTVLAARWRHRRSDDIDITYDPETETAHFDTTLRPALEAAGGRPLAWSEWSRIEFGDNHIDLLNAEPQPAIGQGRAMIDAKPVTVLTNTQIINGKLHNRSLDPPVRDVYDVAVCGIEDRKSLEIQANLIIPEWANGHRHAAANQHRPRVVAEIHAVEGRNRPAHHRRDAVALEMAHEQVGGGGQIRDRSGAPRGHAAPTPFADRLAAHAEQAGRLMSTATVRQPRNEGSR